MHYSMMLTKKNIAKVTGPKYFPSEMHDSDDDEPDGEDEGDVDGDGLPDLVVGAPNHQDGSLRAGAAYLYLGATEYQQGKDYTVDANNHRLVIPPGSRIPFITTAELYKKKGEPNAISHKLGDPPLAHLCNDQL